MEPAFSFLVRMQVCLKEGATLKTSLTGSAVFFYRGAGFCAR
jgi:hypothetical protein